MSKSQQAFDLNYQMRCDELYWKHGKCCAGCDHWDSQFGKLGHCRAAQIMSGTDVLKSAGIHSCSYVPAPDHPMTRALDHCGRFKDEFDWSQLGQFYLTKIGAMVKGRLLPKPELIAQNPYKNNDDWRLS